LETSKYTGLEIAIIGMSGAFPGASDLETFWDNLKGGVESITFLAEKDKAFGPIDNDLRNKPNYVNALGGILEEKWYFDADFFGYGYREASVMDPQIRLFHEHGYKALEDAGYVAKTSSEQIGLYAASSSHFYWQAVHALQATGNTVEDFGNESMLNKDFLSTRVAYKLNLQGPCITMDTACSSSLVAVHMACRALLTGECTIALAGGVSANAQPKSGYLHHEGMILSPDGHCRAFDADAKGTIVGEGVGVIVLKRLKNALQDKDYIHAIIKGSASNNDGYRKAGYNAPSIEGQTEVIRKVIKTAKTDPASITYVEAHGTGTILGDPIEIKALTNAFAIPQKGICGIGSLKTNIGHLDAAAGIAGLIKTVLSIKHRQIPPSLHFNKPNPHINFDDSPFYVNDQLKEWVSNNGPLRAGVSSFGIGGTNAHVILEEAPETSQTEGHAGQAELFVFSAHSEKALSDICVNFIKYLEIYPGTSLAELAYTLATGRKVHRYRVAIVADSAVDLREQLKEAVTQDYSFPVNPVMKLAFMFPGQGSQYINMGAGLYQKESVFRQELDTCLNHAGLSAAELLYPKTVYEKHDEQLWNTINTQPVLFAFEYALAKLLMSRGLSPEVCIGHSLGELVAACIAGVFTLPQAMKLVKARGSYMQQTPEGAMLNVRTEPSVLLQMLPPGVSVAANNTPDNVTVSGTPEAITALVEKLEKQEIKFTKLKTPHAFHSSLTESILEPFREVVESIPLQAPELPVISNVTGSLLKAEEATSSAYWSRHLRETVQFSEGVKNVLHSSGYVFLEVGPGRTLCSYVRKNAANGPKITAINLIRHSLESKPDADFLLKGIAKAWLEGYNIDWDLYYKNRSLKKLSLSTYPFERTDFQLDDTGYRLGTQLLSKKLAYHKKKIEDWYYQPLWDQTPQSRIRIGRESFQSLYITLSSHDLSAISGLCKNEEAKIVLADSGKLTIYDNDLNRLDEVLSFEELINILPSEQRTPLSVNYLCIKEEERNGIQSNYRHLFILLELVRALSKRISTAPVQLNLIVSQLFRVLGSEKIYAEKAVILGAVKSISIEYSNIACRCIEITDEEFYNGKISSAFKNELRSTSRDLIVALRDKQRLIPSYKPVSLARSSGASLSIRRGGIYLITGGFGGMGFTLAEYLALEYKATVILLGHSHFPAKTEWGGYLSQNHGGNISNKIRRLQKMQASGALVDFYIADIADKEAMTSVIEDCLQKHGKINGVLHAAGKPDYGGVIQRRSSEEILKIMASKCEGTRVLEQLLVPHKPEFVLLFSTLGNVLYKHKFGQVGYNCANEFMDAWVYDNGFSEATFVTSVNWDDWAEVGMTVKALQRNYKLEDVSQADQVCDAITNREGVEVMLTVLESQIERLVISTLPLDTRLELMDMEADHSFHNSPLRDKTRINGRASQKSFLSTNGGKDNVLSGIFFSFFNKKVDPDEDFFELGGDSLHALNLLGEVNDKLGVKVPMEYFFNSPTLIGLEKFVDEATREDIITSSLRPETDYVIFNSDAEPSIFCFPPAISYGVAYMKLAEKLKNYKFYSFNFIYDDDRLEKYYQLITSLQPVGPYVLFGYSAGGGLAFEVARHLEEKGHTVSHVVLVDTYVYKHFKKLEDEHLFKTFLDELQQYFNKQKIPDQELILENVRNYYMYNNTLMHKEKVKASIHLLEATDRIAKQQEVIAKLTEEEVDSHIPFNNLTEGEFIVYHSHGGHDEMFAPGYLSPNANLIDSVLYSIFQGKPSNTEL
jgi:acyl transferase domain-containing protein/thioesterase domain-containing protein/acyl carrier protein